MTRKRLLTVLLPLTAAIVCGPVIQLAHADGGATRPRVVASVANAPIGVVESWGAVVINGQQVGRQSLLWSGDRVQAPAGSGAQAALTAVGQVSVRPGAVVRLAAHAAQPAATGRTLVASLERGEFAVALKPDADARFEVDGELFVASRGANFRATVRADGVSVETSSGSVMPVGRWAVDAPKNVVRDAAALRAAGQAAGQPGQTGQAAARRYIIRPYNLGLNTDVRARSTRSLQVRVTDENDRPVPDAPVLFLLGGAGGGSGGAGGAAGAATLNATTNSNGVASIQFDVPDLPGNRIQVRAQVQGTEAVWEGSLRIVAARAGFWAPQNAVPIFAVVGVGIGFGIKELVDEDSIVVIPPITQRPGGTVIVP